MNVSRLVAGCACVLGCLLFGCAGTTHAARPGLQERAQEERRANELVSIGDAYASFGDSVRAAQYYSLAIEIGGDERTIFPRLLDMCIRDRQFRAALFHVEDYLRRHPENVKLRFLAGSLYASMGEVKLAHSEYDSAALGDPNNAEIQYAFAVLSRDHEGNLVAADSHFRAYLSLEPSGAHAEEARSSLLKSVP